MIVLFKNILGKVLPKPLYVFVRAIYYFFSRSLRRLKDKLGALSFLMNQGLNASFKDKLRIIRQLSVINAHVESPHTQDQILSYIKTILSLPPNGRGVLIEAGCYKGGSTSKFSLAAELAGRELVVFDSFQGIPENTEEHDKNIYGGSAGFKKGDYCGPLDEVKANITKFGKIDSCRFIEGWFDDTMPNYKTTISAIYLDVDLVSSTRTCLKYLYPLLEPGGVLYSQDGHLPLVIDVFDDDQFWRDEIGCEKPQMFGLGKSKLIKVIKEE